MHYDDTKNKDSVALKTPFGKIDLRGTKVWGGLLEEEYMIYVEDGGINVSNEHGFVAVENGYGTIFFNEDEAPLPAEMWTSEEIQWIKELVAF